MVLSAMLQALSLILGSRPRITADPNSRRSYCSALNCKDMIPNGVMWCSHESYERKYALSVLLERNRNLGSKAEAMQFWIRKNACLSTDDVTNGRVAGE